MFTVVTRIGCWLCGVAVWVKRTLWPWLKDNWKKVVVVAGVLAAFILGRRGKKTSAPVDREQSDAAGEYQEQRNQALEEEIEGMAVSKDVVIREAIEDFQDQSDDMGLDMRGDVRELQENPDELNKRLIEMGNKVRK